MNEENDGGLQPGQKPGLVTPKAAKKASLVGLVVAVVMAVAAYLSQNDISGLFGN